MRDVMVEINAIPGVQNIAEKRQVKVYYRDIELQCEVHSLQSHVDLFYQAYMRGKATEMGTLMALPGESDMIDCPESASIKVSSGMADAHTLRTLMNTIVSAMPPPLNAEKIEDRGR
eukprot:6490302-Amphidinium_carterae.5